MLLMLNAHSAHAHSNIDLGARARGKQRTNKRTTDKKKVANVRAHGLYV